MDDTVLKMGFEPNANHVARKFKNKPVTLQFTFEPVTYNFRSKLESRYANYLERLRELGQILGWWYEKIKLEFPDYETSPKEWTPDFLVLLPSAELEIHECKGYCEQKDAKKLARTKEQYDGFDKMVMIFARENKSRPRVKASVARWAEIRYADSLFRQVFGNTKCGVE
jgi:hypothetical protein